VPTAQAFDQRSYPWTAPFPFPNLFAVKVISQREFHSNPAEVLEALEAGETFRITRDDAEIIELRPPAHGRHVTTDEIIEMVKDLPEVDYAEMRAEADAFFGVGRIGDNDS
jgi:hypothetical protein